MSEYCSTDRNITIRFEAQPTRPPDDDDYASNKSEDTEDFRWAHVTILHPFLVRMRYNGTVQPGSDDYTLYSKITNAPVLCLKRPDGQAIAPGKELPRCLAKIVEEGAKPLNELRRGGAKVSQVFHVVVPSQCEDMDHTPAHKALSSSSGVLVPEVQQILDDAVHQRRQQMEVELAAFVRRQQDALETFVAQTTEEAETLSDIASIASLKQEQKDSPASHTSPQKKPAIKKNKDRVPSKQSPVLATRKSAAEEDTSASDRSTSAGHRRTSSSSKPRHKRPPHRSETTPLPKSVLLKEVRRKSSMSHLSDGSSRCSDTTSPVTPKRVMFSEQEPQRIESPALSSDPEDDPSIKTASERLQASTFHDDVDVDDVFEMDETIPVVPLPQPQGLSLDSPVLTGKIPAGRIYGRQSDQGLSGSFKMRSLEKYGEDDDEGGEVPSLTTPDARLKSQSSNLLTDDAPSNFATSLPRDVPTSMQPVKSPAIINSVKDLPGISPPTIPSPASPVDDMPPCGMPRDMAWRKAVQSSLRMSGLIMPTQAAEDVERALQQTLSKQGATA
ncbi:hypothetical protein BCR37DRAFT_387792 [Protomyces lactucae-debilis]|uniref:Uncharacterized protein n=1 Tax=Protomyces lactucae-debilis TaxID=2754530 RepID=A0A1Y2FCA0_PROLT|nr:uncharacterized protein BCR37DRAFT_387792 [Protomyces lactucae-debilis]ORY81550.1 hypothetical protein BCR37DRAFT_387792 [Protomyces lactucae-debilis]